MISISYGHAWIPYGIIHCINKLFVTASWNLLRHADSKTQTHSNDNMDTVYKGAVLVFCFMKSLIWNLVVLTFHHKKYFHLRQNLPWLRFKNSHQSGDSDSFRNWPNQSLGRYISGHHLTPKSFSGEFNYLSITTQITGWLSNSFNIGISWGPLV